MKRLISLIGVCLILIGLRFYDTGLARVVPDGQISVFSQEEPALEVFSPTGADCYRIDLYGSENVQKLLDYTRAKVQFTEMDGQLIYAYSPRISTVKWVHGKRVNIMIYHNGDKVCAGVPLLKGSY